jgi:hypothetical protein
MIFSFLFGDANVQIRLQNGQKAQGEFVGTYMNHVHILMGDNIYYYACDEIASITNANEGYSFGNKFKYDCSINTVTADILFPPQLDPMTGEMAQILPDVFNPDIPKPAVEKATPVVQNPAAKVEAGGVSAAEDFVVIDGVKYARVAPEKETAQADYGHYLTNTGSRGTTLSTLEIRSLAIVNAGQKHNGAPWGLLGLAGCGTGMMGAIIGAEIADFPGFIIGSALGLSLPSLSASAAVPVPHYPAEIKTQSGKQLYKDAYVKEAGRLRRRSTVTGTGVGLLGFGAFMLSWM